MRTDTFEHLPAYAPCWSDCFASMLPGSLSVDTGTHCLRHCVADTANTADKIGPVPELRFLVDSSKVCGKAISGTAGVVRTFHWSNGHAPTL